MQVDSSIFQLDHEILVKRYKHIGVLGKGRDFMLEIPCVIHMMQDKFTEKKVMMQSFPSLNEEIVKIKLVSLKQSNFELYVGNWCRIIGYTQKKVNKTISDLMILYQVDGIIGPTLENVISKRKKDNQPFSEQEILEFIFNISESMYVSQSSEYLDISPINIFVPVDQGPCKLKYFISNCGLCFKGTKWDKKFHCPSDAFFNGKISERNVCMAHSSNIFILGMIALQMMTFNDLQDIYGNDDKTFKEDLLVKKIEELKKLKKKFSEQLVSLITQMVQTKEERRFILKSIFDNPDYQKLFKSEREYTENKVENSTKYKGMIKNQLPDGNGHIIYADSKIYSGHFSQGLRNGFGLFYNGTNFVYGEWDKDKLKNGGLYKKNKYIYEGQINENYQLNGKGCIMSNNTSEAFNSIMYFEGIFKDGQKQSGTQFYKDGYKYIGEFKNNKRSGKGQLFWPKNIQNWTGEFVDDEMSGKGKMNIYKHEECKEVEAEFEKGTEKQEQQ